MASNLVFILVPVLNLIALALALIATGIGRARRVRHPYLGGDYSYCAYNFDAASGLGIGAFVLLLASQIFITSVSNCLCCGKKLRPGCAQITAIFLFVICWITFCIAELFLLTGSQSIGGFKLVETVSCSTVRRGVFVVADVSILITAILSQLYYVCYRKARVKPSNQIEREVVEHPVE